MSHDSWPSTTGRSCVAPGQEVDMWSFDYQKLIYSLPSGNQTWQWKMDHVLLILLVKSPCKGDFHCHVWWPEGIQTALYLRVAVPTEVANRSMGSQNVFRKKNTNNNSATNTNTYGLFFPFLLIRQIWFLSNPICTSKSIVDGWLSNRFPWLIIF